MQQYDVLVIGAGPAGISAAVYAASKLVYSKRRLWAA